MNKPVFEIVGGVELLQQAPADTIENMLQNTFGQHQPMSAAEVAADDREFYEAPAHGETTELYFNSIEDALEHLFGLR